jgi:hypothetical protein
MQSCNMIRWIYNKNEFVHQAALREQLSFQLSPTHWFQVQAKILAQNITSMQSLHTLGKPKQSNGIKIELFHNA